jgi:ribosomal protein S18 acetylase RimI-like enzyme
MIAIEPITIQNAGAFKEIRLRALQDSPSAFSSTYARESQFSDADWAQRIERWNGEKGVGFLAMDGDSACGIAGSLLDEEDGSRAQLVSMWTAPTHRSCGVGRLLVEGVLGWASRLGVHVLTLMVTSINDGAMSFYERLGFERTGKTLPYPNDPAVVEYEMSRMVGQARVSGPTI